VKTTLIDDIVSIAMGGLAVWGFLTWWASLPECLL
jgi:hypothetical protein